MGRARVRERGTIAGAHSVPTLGRVPALISNSNETSKIDCFTVYLLYVMYICIVITYFVRQIIDQPVATCSWSAEQGK